MEELNQLTEDLPAMYNQMRNTDRFLHKILPFTIQNQLIDATSQMEPKSKLPLLKQSATIFEDLVTKLNDEEIQFDKMLYVVPDLDELINEQ
jgi:hypothetical protein